MRDLDAETAAAGRLAQSLDLPMSAPSWSANVAGDAVLELASRRAELGDDVVVEWLRAEPPRIVRQPGC